MIMVNIIQCYLVSPLSAEVLVLMVLVLSWSRFGSSGLGISS